MSAIHAYSVGFAACINLLTACEVNTIFISMPQSVTSGSRIFNTSHRPTHLMGRDLKPDTSGSGSMCAISIILHLLSEGGVDTPDRSTTSPSGTYFSRWKETSTTTRALLCLLEQHMALPLSTMTPSLWNIYYTLFSLESTCQKKTYWPC